MRDWVAFAGSAAPAYGSASSYPVAGALNLYLSGSGTLASNPDAVVNGTQEFLAPAAGVPTSIEPLNASNAASTLAGGAPIPALEADAQAQRPHGRPRHSTNLSISPASPPFASL